MTMSVVCPRCGARYELSEEMSGRSVMCRACSSAFVVSPGAEGMRAQPSPAPGQSPPPYGGQPASPYGPQHAPPYGSPPWLAGQRRASFEVHRKVIGVFNVVVGALSLMWALLMAIETIAFLGGMIPQERDGPPTEVMVGTFLGLMVFSGVTGIVQLWAGIALLRVSPGARKLGIASGICSCISLWGCCVYPFCLASGIYTLIILLGDAARECLDRP